MKNFLRLRKSDFFCNSMVLISGATVAQATGMLAIPFITRLYSQTDMGMLGAFIGVVGILGQLTCLRYEQAIMLAEEHEVQILVTLSLGIMGAITALLACLVAFWGQNILQAIGIPQLSGWLWLLPIVAFTLGLFQVLQVLLSREKSFSSQSTSRIAKASTEASSQIGWAVVFGASATGLITGHVAGILLQTCILARASKLTLYKILSEKQSIKSTWLIAKKYSNFPIYAVPSGIVGVFGQQGFTLILAIILGPNIAGLFYLAHRVLALPTSLISQSLGPTFYQRLSVKKGNSAEEQSFIATVFVSLLILGVIPIALLVIFAPSLFNFCFGPTWESSGNIVRSIWPVYLMMFCAIPITQTFYIYEKQAAGFLWQTASVTIRILVVYFVNELGGMDLAFLAYGLTGALMYSLVILMSLGWAGCRMTELPHVLLSAAAKLAYLVSPKKVLSS